MAEIIPQQILVPKKVYIGDTAELRCSFNSPDAKLKALTAEGSVRLPFISQPETELTEDYEIKSITLSPSGVDFYQFTITFVPWKTGDLLFPPMQIEGSDLVLEFQPVQIVSLITAENQNSVSLHDTAAPLLLPGTAYKLYGFLAGLIILIIVLIRLFVKRKNLLFYINQRRLLKKYKKNKKQTIRALYRIADEAEDKKINDKTAAEKIQKTLRNYLEVRFNYPFTHAAASEIMKGWQTATGGLLSDTKTESFEEIAVSFVRTDYIRYSKSSAFKPDELNKLIESLVSNIQTLEKNEESQTNPLQQSADSKKEASSDDLPLGE